jgi:hypothetical protein
VARAHSAAMGGITQEWAQHSRHQHAAGAAGARCPAPASPPEGSVFGETWKLHRGK